MRREMVPLGLLSKGERGVIVEIRGEDLKGGVPGCSPVVCEFCCGKGSKRGHGVTKGDLRKVRDMGLEVGKVVEVLSNVKGEPILVLIENCRLALSRGIAMKILVEPLRGGSS